MTRLNRKPTPVDPVDTPPSRVHPVVLDDRALLAALISAGAHADAGAGDALEAAGRLLLRFGSLGGVAAADARELSRVAKVGIDVPSVMSITRELAVRLARADAARRPVIASWTQLEAYVRVAMAHLPREEFRVLYLDHRNNLMADEFLAEGTTNHAPVYPREVIRRALEVSASAMVLVHNHPSGDPTPSRADIEMTRKVVDAASCLGLQIHDHIIVGRDGTASFRALGLM